MSRLFVFGCSMTRYVYATWADLISQNFDEYYNYGKSGSDNVLSMNRFFEANKKFNFDPKTDTIMIMITGLGRFSYYKTNESWFTHGDLYSYLDKNKNPIIEQFVKSIFDLNCAIYRGWAAINSVKEFLVAKQISHKFFLGIDIECLKTISDCQTENYVEDLIELSENKLSFDRWTIKKAKELNINNTIYWEVEKRPDGHPNQRMHYEFVKTFLPNLDTEKTKETFEYVESILDKSRQDIQNYSYNELFHRKNNKMYQYPLFGQQRGEI